METLITDIRYAVRALSRRPGFLAAAVAMLALGIGANTTIFSLINALLLRPPTGVADPGTLAVLYTSDFSGPPYGGSSWPDLRDIAAETSVFAGVAGYGGNTISLGEGEELQTAEALAVSAGYFDVLGARPALGRFFLASEDAAPEDIVVLSNGVWRARFGAAPDIIGRAIRINGRPFTVVGVAAEGFKGVDLLERADLWIPARAAERANFPMAGVDDRSSRGIHIVARLAEGVKVDQAQRAANLIAARLQGAWQQQWTDVRGERRRLTVLSESAARVPPSARAQILTLVGVLAATVGMVLLICCANVAGLLLARAAGRRREIGIRASLGAGRGRLVRQMLTESMVLAAIGAVLGIVLSFWLPDLLVGALVGRGAGALPFELSLDSRVLGFTLVATIATGLLFGLAPALRASRVDVVSTLRGAGDGGSHRRLNARGLLVSGQFALSLVLLTAALLLVRTLRSAYGIDPGFRTTDVLLAPVSRLPGAEGGEDPSTVALQLQERIQAIPGVQAVSWGSSMPLSGSGSRTTFSIEGYSPAPGEDMEFHFNSVGPRWFETTGVAIVRGRGIEETDREGAPGAVVVNETFARRFFPGEDAIGHRLSNGPLELTIVGVARDVNWLSLTGAVRPYIWFSAMQRPGGLLFSIRTVGPPMRIATAVTGIVESAGAGWLLRNARSLEEQLSTSLFSQRLAAMVIGGFGVLALLLAAAGLYGVVAFAVAQRTREVGVRLALGARPSAVRGLFVRQSLPFLAIGAVVGLAGAFAATRVLGGILIGVSATDPVAFIVAPVLLAGAALLASWVPARRAAKVDPIVALRAE